MVVNIPLTFVSAALAFVNARLTTDLDAFEEWDMHEIKENKKTKNIAFRVTNEEYAQIERVALAVGEDPNNWCRSITVAEAREGPGLTKTERLLYEEIARVRYLVGHGFRLLFASKEATAAAWKKLTADADHSSE
ncbi:MAG: hypothetical protein M3Y84_06165, partial [Acidobacteriota bacterium]|nr:hypothetical protein [Acidobacteriota bacterium]